MVLVAGQGRGTGRMHGRWMENVRLSVVRDEVNKRERGRSAPSRPLRSARSSLAGDRVRCGAPPNNQVHRGATTVTG